MLIPLENGKKKIPIEMSVLQCLDVASMYYRSLYHQLVTGVQELKLLIEWWGGK